MTESLYETESVKDFEIKILTGGNCKFFLPMTFLKTEEGIRIIYVTDGYRKLCAEEINNTYLMLHIVEQIVIGVWEAVNYLILWDRFQLSKDLLFIDEKTNFIKIKFVPMDGKKIAEGKELNEILLELILSLPVQDKRCCEYLDMLCKRLKQGNLSKTALLNYVGELKREVYLCGWEG